MPNRDEEITDLEGLIQGDSVAFERIYRRYRDRVYGFAFRMLNSQPLAEEVTHDAFLVLIEHPQRFRKERGSLLTFLCVIVRNRVMNHFRHKSYEATTNLGDDFEQVGNETISDKDALAKLMDDELTEEINRAVGSLPILLREAIVLREFQELSYEEIAEVAGASINTIKVRLHRARRTLSEALAPYMYEERRH